MIVKKFTIRYTTNTIR